MITFLEGILVEKEPTRVVLNVGGVGYELFIPLTSYDRLPKSGETCRLLTYDHVREDIHALYGFSDDDGRKMFLRLMDVSGIGPKLALTVLSGLSIKDLKAAIVQADVKRLSTISGIGRKTAERIVVELRDKIGKGESIEAVAGSTSLEPGDLRYRDAILALIALGYKQGDAQKMVENVLPGLRPNDGVEDLVRRALAR